MCVTNMPFYLLNSNAYHQFQTADLVKVIKTYSYLLYEEQHNNINSFHELLKVKQI